jgi:hypothetical protein
MSRSTATPSGGLKPNTNAKSVDPGQVGRGPAQTDLATAPHKPEWKTERWMLRVEAEARSRLKKSIRQVGSER